MVELMLCTHKIGVRFSGGPPDGTKARHQTQSSVMNCTVPCVFPISTSKANKNRTRVPFVQRIGHLTTDQETGVQIFYGTPIMGQYTVSSSGVDCKSTVF